MSEETDLPLPLPSDTIKRLREMFYPLAAKLEPEQEPAIVYQPGPTEA